MKKIPSKGGAVASPLAHIRQLADTGSSQLYVKTVDKTILKLRDDNGVIQLRLPGFEYKSIIDQLRTNKKS